MLGIIQISVGSTWRAIIGWNLQTSRLSDSNLSIVVNKWIVTLIGRINILVFKHYWSTFLDLRRISWRTICILVELCKHFDEIKGLLSFDRQGFHPNQIILKDCYLGNRLWIKDIYWNRWVIDWGNFIELLNYLQLFKSFWIRLKTEMWSL